MEEVNIEAKCKELRNTLEEIKGLLAWEQLKHSEVKPGQPPGFVLADPVDQDIKNQYSRFLAVRVQIRSILNSPDPSGGSAGRIGILRQKLTQAEREFQNLNLNERFIKF